ncbi:putative reverse transcriptase domain-containing protein [Tanacetum coccineum]|uniref:Reverse transcriptase domain-containing protein n=1 Tax=Tanacetum coccineum TaxID=301880 RepID=A0ABQ5B1Z0_9ASTR
MPLSTYTNLGLGELSHTRMTIELADRTIKQPRGIASNVLVRIVKFIFPINFVILDIPEDGDIPLILGRPFLLAKARIARTSSNFYAGPCYIECGVSIHTEYGVSSFLTNTAYSSQLINMAYPVILDTAKKIIRASRLKKVMVDIKVESSLEKFVLNDKADYYSRIISITVNGKNAYELKGKFLEDLHNNAFSGTNRKDAVKHIEYYLKIINPIILPNVNQDKLRIGVFPMSLTAFNEFNYLLKVDPDLLIKDIEGFKTYEDYKNDWIYKWNKDMPWVNEKPWGETGVWTNPTPVKHTCKPFNYKTGCLEWPAFSWMNDGYCNGGKFPGTYIIGNQLHYQDNEWYEDLEDNELKDLALRNKASMKGLINDDDELMLPRRQPGMLFNFVIESVFPEFNTALANTPYSIHWIRRPHKGKSTNIGGEFQNPEDLKVALDNLREALSVIFGLSVLEALIDRGVAAAMAEAEASRVRNGYDSNGSGPRPAQAVRECTYPDFLKCQPLNFKGTEGVVGLTQWSRSYMVELPCEDYYSGSCQALPWKILKKMMTDKYCPMGEIKKLDIEMWELKTKGTNVVGYSHRFQELALMCNRMFPEESDRVEKYVGGLPDIINDSVMATRPKTMQEAIEFATELMDKKIRDVVKNK